MTTPHPAAVSAAKEISTADYPMRATIAQMTAIITRHYAPVLDAQDKRIAELEARTTPICIGRQIVGHLARDGQWLSESGAGVIAADELYRKDPYERIAELEAQIVVKDAALESMKEMLESDEADSLECTCATSEHGCRRCSYFIRKQNIVNKALSPNRAEGWLSPAEAERLKSKTIGLEADILALTKQPPQPQLDWFQIAVSEGMLLPLQVEEQKRQAQIRALEWARKQFTAHQGFFLVTHDKLEALKSGGPLL